MAEQSARWDDAGGATQKQLPFGLCQLLAESGVFCADWYATRYADLIVGASNPLDHYLSHGFRANLAPHPLFDPEFYASRYPASTQSGMVAFEHYVETGAAKGCAPSALLDPEYYARRYSDDRAHPMSARGALFDFCGADDRLAGFPQIDATVLIGSENGGGNSPNRRLESFLTHGLPAGGDPHPLIQIKRLAPDAEGFARLDAFYSFCDGAPEYEDVSPHPLFNLQFYREKRPQADGHPLLHYLRNWDREPLWPSPFFDAAYYVRQLGERPAPDPFSHYLEHGEKLGLRPNRYFDDAYYRERHGHQFAGSRWPYVHYTSVGNLPDFSPSPEFGQRFYLTRNPGAKNALIHFLHFGEAHGLRPLPPRPYFDTTAGLDEAQIVERIRAAAPRLDDDPLVSVIVPVYGNLDYTLKCLWSIVSSRDTTSYEILIADDRSPGDVGQRLAEAFEDCPVIRVDVNETRLGFLRSCNAAAQRSRGRYLLFLNNDTWVLDGWLDELVATFARVPAAGLVGSKLLYPNGLLQEAGGIVWEGAAAANVGRNDDPEHPAFNYMRDVDYISGAAILVAAEAWEKVGGFSDAFAPSYYEDTDLAFKLRRAGYRTIYQPLSRIVHFEGVTSGTDIGEGEKRYQAVNAERFAEAWAGTLASHGRPGDLSRGCVDRCARGRVLVYDAQSPMPDQDSGSMTAFHLMSILCDLGYRVTFIPQSLAFDGRYSRDLQRRGVETLCQPYISDVSSYLRDHAGDYDLVVLSRAPVGGEIIGDIRGRYPDLPLVFDTVDLHHLRLERECQLTDTAEPIEAAEMKRVELKAIQLADLTLLSSTFEAAYLTDVIGPFPHVVLPLIYDVAEATRPPSGRRDVAFVGGFRHPPNVDAVEYLIDKIWPAVRALGLDARLHVIGSRMPPSIRDRAADDIVMAGFVPDLEAYLARIRATIAPLRYGAGVKGKVGNSLRLGVPCIASPAAVEGMGLVDGEHVIVASEPSQYAEAIGMLCRDDAAWTSYSSAGRAFAERKFGVEAARETLSRVCAAFIDARRAGDRGLSPGRAIR